MDQRRVLPDGRPLPGVFIEELGVWGHSLILPLRRHALVKLLSQIAESDHHWVAYSTWWFLRLLDRDTAAAAYSQLAQKDDVSDRLVAYRSINGDRRSRRLSVRLATLRRGLVLPRHETTFPRGTTESAERRFEIARHAARAGGLLDELEREAVAMEGLIEEDRRAGRAPWEQHRLRRLFEMFELFRERAVSDQDIVQLVLRVKDDWCIAPCDELAATLRALTPKQRLARVRGWRREAET